ncbi:MAG: malonate decarboxylase acyl carrier protein [Rhodoferax sp.]|uniref:malonate decarboxylase acyl carrier protein n=1 Tax=Rhodoferax sp. TaxID=50421 RepID=UPI003263F41C
MSDIPAGLETLDFSYPAGQPAGNFAPILVGVVGSGNLEVLLEPAAGMPCAVRVETSARGFAPIWQAVVDDFHARHPLTGVRISIHDMGATPAVVSLRLDQAVAELPEIPGAST